MTTPNNTPPSPRRVTPPTSTYTPRNYSSDDYVYDPPVENDSVDLLSEEAVQDFEEEAPDTALVEENTPIVENSEEEEPLISDETVASDVAEPASSLPDESEVEDENASENAPLISQGIPLYPLDERTPTLDSPQEEDSDVWEEDVSSYIEDSVPAFDDTEDYIEDNTPEEKEPPTNSRNKRIHQLFIIIALVLSMIAIGLAINSIQHSKSIEEKPAVTKTVTVTPTITKTVTVSPDKNKPKKNFNEAERIR